MSPGITQVMFKALYLRLPLAEPALKDISRLPLKELYKLCDPYLSDLANLLWDGSTFTLRKETGGNYSGELLAYFAMTEEDRVNGFAVAEQQWLPVITSRMKSIYEALQAKTKEINPASEWNTVSVSLARSGYHTARYELNGEEITLV